MPTLFPERTNAAVTGRNFTGESPRPKPDRTPRPADTGLEYPAAVVIGQPTPRLISDEGPAKKGIEEPVAIIKRGPTKSASKGPPAVTKTRDGIKTAVGVEVAEARSVGGGV